MAFYLRIEGLFNPTFHADEALFGTWSRKIFALHDPLLVGEAADKPPLLFYLQSLTYNLLHPTQFASRIPNLIASMALIPLCAHILPSHNPFQREGDRFPTLRGGLRGGAAVKFLTMFIIAIHPLTIKHSATAFTDPLMLTLSIAALTTIHKRPVTSGFLFGLAVATKYHALIFVPLICVLLGGRAKCISPLRAAVKSLVGFAIPLTLLILWLTIPERAVPFGQTGDSVLLRGIRPVHAYQLIPRFITWQLWLTIPIALIYGTICKTPKDRLFALCLLGYSALLWLFSFPIYERYLLPTIPFIAIGIARLWMWPSSTLRRFKTFARFCLLIFIGLTTLFTFSTKPDTQNRPNLQPIIETLEEQPAETVLYDHYYSWQLRYFLYDNHTVYTAWIPHADALITDLNAFYTETPPRLLLLPSSLTTNHSPLITSSYERRLNAAGYQLRQLTTTDTITLYRVVSD